MEVQDDEFNTLRQNTVEIIYEIESLNSYGNLLRECARAESSRAEAKSSAREAARRAAAEARAGTAAVSAAAERALAEHTALSADLVAAKMQLGINERERSLLQQRCSELSLRADSLVQELQRLSAVPAARAALQRSYADLEGRMKRAIEEARTEQSHLQNEFRSIENSCAGGIELRGRARRAAAAHERERRLADAERRQATEELLKTNAEMAHLKAELAQEQQHRKELHKEDSIIKALGDEKDLVLELRAQLATERTETERLERALSAVLADNAALAARLAAADNRSASVPGDTASELVAATNMTAVDSFLNEF